MSKADTAGTESDRQRVLMQITQELCKRPGLNKCGFDMPTIFIPSLTDKVSNKYDYISRRLLIWWLYFQDSACFINVFDTVVVATIELIMKLFQTIRVISALRLWILN